MGSASYLAVWRPRTDEGVVFVAAPDGGPAPVALPLGRGDSGLRLRADHRYSLSITSDGNAFVAWPKSAVIRRHALATPATTLSVAPLTPPAGELGIGNVTDNIGDRQLAVTAVVGYWPIAPTVAVRSGDACPSRSGYATCAEDSPSTTFARDTYWLYGDGTTSNRYVSGRTYAHPARRSYVCGHLQTLATTPFTSGYLIAFGVHST